MIVFAVKPSRYHQKSVLAKLDLNDGKPTVIVPVKLVVIGNQINAQKIMCKGEDGNAGVVVCNG